MLNFEIPKNKIVKQTATSRDFGYIYMMAIRRSGLYRVLLFYVSKREPSLNVSLVPLVAQQIILFRALHMLSRYLSTGGVPTELPTAVCCGCLPD